MKACVDVDHFSGSVLVSKGGETIFARGYGYANAEHQVPNTTRTRFRLGSITKQFTAMAILILEEQGKLKVEDPVGKYIDDAPEGVGRRDDPPPPDPHRRRAQLHRWSRLHGEDDDARDRQEHDRPVPRQAAGVQAGREVPLQQLGIFPPGRDHREGLEQELRGIPQGGHLRPPRHEGHGVRPLRHAHPQPRRGLHPHPGRPGQRPVSRHVAALFRRIAVLDRGGPRPLGPGPQRGQAHLQGVVREDVHPGQEQLRLRLDGDEPRRAARRSSTAAGSTALSPRSSATPTRSSAWWSCATSSR